MLIVSLPRPHHELRDRNSIPIHPYPEKVKHEVDHQRTSPCNQQVPPRLPCPEDVHAGRNREPKFCAERLAYAVEDDLAREVGGKVQRSTVRDEDHADGDVAAYEGGGYFEWIGAQDQVDGKLEELEDEGA